MGLTENELKMQIQVCEQKVLNWTDDVICSTKIDPRRSWFYLIHLTKFLLVQGQRKQT